ncbi:Similar to KN motif and ankyrin repeat domain-containing protein 2; acc. no. Q1LZH7 [Pyronema omphalodes CBS 100304]|uniref:Similar to KN motif and ankyrin repeat domain-containing protein 2 acc. no. Q1LZH7 n=1 Tax=Pyronema omphalodes (strain CBS 100304) TaxID=1076935 RepID=U4KU24_PYROM|nr:Similar to KN motif and ankyrin repeat domain-containing protein 2; acc. no. Q1LZH7 [Pyronema omphalodes CBS 100304]
MALPHSFGQPRMDMPILYVYLYHEPKSVLADYDGNTAPMRAASRGYGEIVSLLLSRPDIDCGLKETKSGFRAIELAAHNGHTEVFSFLKEHERTNNCPIHVEHDDSTLEPQFLQKTYSKPVSRLSIPIAKLSWYYPFRSSAEIG